MQTTMFMIGRTSFDKERRGPCGARQLDLLLNAHPRLYPSVVEHAGVQHDQSVELQKRRLTADQDDTDIVLWTSRPLG